jgi:ubiquitin carboxyl-terminal hydrolase 26/29/37
MSSDASAPPKSSSRSSTALPNAAYSANAERGASVRAEPEAPEAPGAAPASAAGFGPPVAANPFAAAAKAAARTSAHRAEAGPAGTPEVRGAPRLGAALEPRVAPARRAPPSRVPGLVNLGNTCYLAATAQLLCGLDAFAGDVDGLPDAYLNANARGSAPEGAGGDARDAPSFDGVAGAARDLVRAREAHAARFDDAATRASATAALVPARLKRAVQRRRPRYEGYEQHDAHEFLCDALDALAEEVADAERSERFPDKLSDARTDARRSIGSLASGRSREWVPLHRTRCPTRRAFTGASAVTLTCETCGDASTSVESFRHLSLEIPPSETSETSETSESAPLELQALIARCFASETVERRCARAGCGGTRAAMARRLLRAPRALLMHLKRFRAEDASRETCGDASFLHPSVSGDSRRGYVGTNAFAPPRLTKDARPVSLPETLTLAPFADAAVRGPPPPIASAGTRGGDGRSAGFADSDLSADEAAAATRTYAADDSAAGEAARAQLASYRLAGVVSHLGASMRRGHYVASARVDSGGEDENGTAAKRWMSFDDERASFAGSPAGSASAAGDWYVAAFECEAAR